MGNGVGGKGYAWVVEIRNTGIGFLNTEWGPYSIFNSRSKAREAARTERKWSAPWHKFRVVKYVRIRGRRFRR
jgi:hypothetical protein